LINRGEFRIQDRLAEYLDVIGINEYFGWYEPSFEGLKKLLSNSSPEKPVIITETGADARAGNHGPSHELFTEEHQAETFRQQLALVDQAPYIRGFCPWILYDFRSERRQTGIQKGYNLKGLIDADKDTKKIAFGLIASHYAMRAMSEREA
jgi:beta-glucuronidase